MSLLVKKHDYAAMERKDISDVRHYHVPGGVWVPSITAILDATKTPEQRSKLNDWKKRIGEEKADRIRDGSANLGSVMHENLECWISGLERPKGNNFVWKKGRKLADTVIEQGLCNLDEAWGCEVALHYGDKYAGTTDCVGVHNGKEAIVDFKTARRRKQRGWIEDYFSQGSAYAMAHNRMFGTNIKKTVIMMMTHDGEYLEFVCDGEEFMSHCMRWALKVKEYHEGEGR